MTTLPDFYNNNGVLALKDIVVQQPADAEVLWQGIDLALVQISEQIIEWGARVKQLAHHPARSTVEQLVEELNSLDQSIFQLIRWLRRQQSQRWITLRINLERARELAVWTQAVPSLSVYARWLILDGPNQNPSKDEELWYDQQRQVAGEGMLWFGDALSRATDV